MSGTSKAVSKLPPNPHWAQADAVFQQLSPPALEVESALQNTANAWATMAHSVKTFAAAMRAIPPGDNGGPGDNFVALTLELESQVADPAALSNGLDRVLEAQRLLAEYCAKIRALQELRQKHEKAVTEAQYYREKVEKVRESHSKKKKVTDADLEKRKRNDEKLKSCDELVALTELQFAEGVDYLHRNKAVVFDRVLVGYIVGQSTLFNSNPFRGLSNNVQADFSTMLAAELDKIDLNATVPGASASLAALPPDLAANGDLGVPYPGHPTPLGGAVPAEAGATNSPPAGILCSPNASGGTAGVSSPSVVAYPTTPPAYGGPPPRYPSVGYPAGDAKAASPYDDGLDARLTRVSASPPTSGELAGPPSPLPGLNLQPSAPPPSPPVPQDSNPTQEVQASAPPPSPPVGAHQEELAPL